jgi:hypothetical protein
MCTPRKAGAWQRLSTRRAPLSGTALSSTETPGHGGSLASLHVYHPVGTRKMGPASDQMAVVISVKDG